MDLFDQISSQQLPGTPLADQLRPQKIEDIIGQEEILGSSSAFRQMLDSGFIPSVIFWGPPGTGKTTVARSISHQIQAEFIVRNAVDTGAKELKVLGDEARNRRRELSQKTILFIDEIHRLNKAQQDVLLPFIERGDYILIGATTENPSYELNRALLSRCRVIVFKMLTVENLENLLQKALSHSHLDASRIFDSESKALFAQLADGDGRRLYNNWEQLLKVYQVYPEKFPIQSKDLLEILERPMGAFDKQGELHYDLISAFIKSVRGSDVDAALYYLARMLKGGADPLFIARRLIILASEDIGNADPRALTVAVNGLQAFEVLGFPEGAIVLGQVTTYLTSAPKSNRSYLALKKAQEYVENHENYAIPLALRSSRTSLGKELGYGRDYKYSHDYEKGWVDQSFLPQEVKGVQFYEPAERGYEKHIIEYQKWLKGQGR